MKSLTTPTRLSRKWKCELDLSCVSACVCMRGSAMKAICLGEYFILNWTLLNCLA